MESPTEKTLTTDEIGILDRYSRGEIDPNQAMEALGSNYYGDLVILLSKADLPFPGLPENVKKKLVADFVRIMK